MEVRSLIGPSARLCGGCPNLDGCPPWKDQVSNLRVLGILVLSLEAQVELFFLISFDQYFDQWCYKWAGIVAAVLPSLVISPGLLQCVVCEATSEDCLDTLVSAKQSNKADHWGWSFQGHHPKFVSATLVTSQFPSMIQMLMPAFKAINRPVYLKEHPILF